MPSASAAKNQLNISEAHQSVIHAEYKETILAKKAEQGCRIVVFIDADTTLYILSDGFF